MAAATAPKIEVRPQAGPQEMFLASPADFVVFGGAAGGGKTWALLLEDLRHIRNPRFGSVTFRRTFVQIDQEGGLWDKSMELYPLLGAIPNRGKHYHTFPSGARARFAHLATEGDVYNYQGGEIALLKFDEITHFNEKEVFYLISRNRSTSGVRPYIRASCNPDPDSWVARFIAWWIGPDGYAIPERSGVVRWFARVDDGFVWADSKGELLENYPQLDPEQPMSFTFIMSRLKDNRVLTDKDPAYRTKLLNLPKVERERLLGDEDRGGNWKIRQAAGEYFKRQWFEVIDVVPPGLKYGRYWDFAATKPSPQSPDPDWTVGLKLGIDGSGRKVVTDLVRTRDTPGEVEKLYKATGRQDGVSVIQHIPQDPGEAGKTVAQSRILMLGMEGITVQAHRPTGDKIVRAGNASSQAEQGLIKVLRAPWNEFFFNQLEAFPDGTHDDVPDVLGDSVNYPPQHHSYGVGGEAAG